MMMMMMMMISEQANSLLMLLLLNVLIDCCHVGYDMAIVDQERQREKMLKKAFNESLSNSPTTQQQQQQPTDNSKLLSSTGGSALSPSHYHHQSSRGSIGSAGQTKASFSERDYQKYVQKLRNQLQQSRTSSSPPNYDVSVGMPSHFEPYDELIHRDTSANPFENASHHRQHYDQSHQQYATTTKTTAAAMNGSHPSMHSDDDYDLEQDFSRNMHIQDFGRWRGGRGILDMTTVDSTV